MNGFSRLLVLFLLVNHACKDADVPVSKSGLYGQWLMTESLQDPGDGSATWQKPSANSYDLISFRRDNSFAGDDGSYNLFPEFSSFRIRSDSTLTLYKKDHKDSLRLRYSLDSRVLQINLPCIEPCGLRFSKTTDF